MNPKVEKSIVITKAWFGRFYRKRHDKVWSGTFPYLTLKGDGTGS